ncbi:hypothetical protein [Streptomyces sp. DSM 15324]|uniref:hypothetical protein n=1 Tax=Streptomyces sp. DSM 15324 TaxID=1739111 RepID=UPI000748F39B|nr:hypothetical protein [Streptomyces sp. DSM 15324]KUO13727.1 hypothetical protein AQJ58_01145 [Streptomyces sp. DSM 15324]
MASIVERPQKSGTDTSVTTSNYVGCRSIAHASSTNVSPSIRYDDFEVLNPQVFSGMTRAVNGMVKAQSAAADVRLALPAYIAL